MESAADRAGSKKGMALPKETPFWLWRHRAIGLGAGCGYDSAVRSKMIGFKPEGFETEKG